MGRWTPVLVAVTALAGACTFDPEGRCDVRADCPAGLDCLNHVCANCRGDLDCWSHTTCSTDGFCDPKPGRCWTDADCESWQSCDATYTCALRADHCPTVACTTLQECDPEHHCSLKPGRCSAAADCPAWMASCDASGNCVFPAGDGDDVLAVGELTEGSCEQGALARASAAATSSSILLGLDCASAPGYDPRAMLDPVSGLPVLRHAEPWGGDTLRIFRRDAATWDAGARRWLVPADPVADDDVAIDPAECPVTWDRWIMRAATGELLYACAVGGEPVQRDYYDAAGLRRLAAVQEALAWNADGYFLVRGGAGALLILNPAGGATAVASLPAGTHLAHRSVAGGFRVALRSEVTGEDELWGIDELTAGATQLGTFATVPSGYDGESWQALDAAGALYGGVVLGSRETLMKRPLQPGTMSALYAEPAATTDFGAATFAPVLRFERILLLTRP